MPRSVSGPTVVAGRLARRAHATGRHDLDSGADASAGRPSGAASSGRRRDRRQPCRVGREQHRLRADRPRRAPTVHRHVAETLRARGPRRASRAPTSRGDVAAVTVPAATGSTSRPPALTDARSPQGDGARPSPGVAVAQDRVASPPPDPLHRVISARHPHDVGTTENASARRPSPARHAARWPPCAAAQHALQVVVVGGLADVRPQRGEFAVVRVGDVDEVIGAVRAAGEPHLPDRPRLEALVAQLRERERVACVRVDRVRRPPRRPRGDPGGSAGNPRSHRRSGLGIDQDPVGPDLADYPGDVTAQLDRRRRRCRRGYPEERARRAPRRTAAAARCSASRSGGISELAGVVVEAAGVTAVTRRYDTSRCRRRTQVATVPAAPKSTSSGWAATHRTRSTSAVGSGESREASCALYTSRHVTAATALAPARRCCGSEPTPGSRRYGSESAATGAQDQKRQLYAVRAQRLAEAIDDLALAGQHQTSAAGGDPDPDRPHRRSRRVPSTGRSTSGRSRRSGCARRRCARRQRAAVPGTTAIRSSLTALAMVPRPGANDPGSGCGASVEIHR